MTKTIKHVSAAGLWAVKFGKGLPEQAKLISRKINVDFAQSLVSAEAWRVDGFTSNKAVSVCLTDSRTYYSRSQDSTSPLMRNEAARMAVSNLASAIGKMSRESVDKDAHTRARAELKSEANSVKFALEIARTNAKLELLNEVLASKTVLVSVPVVESVEVE